MSSSGKAVLVVDFDFTGRPEANFGHFLELLELDRGIWQTTQPPAAAREPVPAERYLDFWSQLPEAATGRVQALLGYCVGGAFLPALADRLEQAQDEPIDLVLFDPEPVTVASLHDDFRKTVDLMSALSADEKTDLVANAREICVPEAEFTSAARKVSDLYRDAVGTAFARLGLDESLSEEFVQVFQSYVSYLAAAAELSPQDGWGRGVALTSRESSPGAVHAAEELNFLVRPGDLLGDPRVAEAVSRILR
ncbi:hypothetical protein [Amycolatopsis sp. CA-230715]|uniref:hypothetical protein n=1 Tax=Amycolatopsis sp. CA-230715 TaxID=2745196 RepID=UPI001C02F2FB|nr:hypothetical protein [Amycolatopsis sp. CA-230715]